MRLLIPASTAAFAFAFQSHWVHTAICEEPDLPALKNSSHWSLGLCMSALKCSSRWSVTHSDCIWHLLINAVLMPLRCDADRYGLGLSEMRMGMALSTHDRESYVLSTKIGECLILMPHCKFTSQQDPHRSIPMPLGGVVGVPQHCTAFIAGVYTTCKLAHFFVFDIFLFARF